MLKLLAQTGEVYQGQFGEFTISSLDRRDVVIYRGGLLVAALAFGLGVLQVLITPEGAGTQPLLTWLFAVFCLALGVSLVTIHIYMAALHRALQVFWLVGCGGAIALTLLQPDPLALAVYEQPLALMGVGWVFVALTGLFFKEAFCFNRLETKGLVVLVPLLLLGHWLGLLPLEAERILLVAWASLFLIFALRKVIQPIPPDIGDKSVFAYLRQGEPATPGV
ncbi:hypothetical protein GS597_16000 [Synechococcales cyanobacterium C]|uniref:DUF2301 domain-containing membrane protein n=1 Tax=Petrachloros mirabilis ULC683 TaxID=2781853 RepID=A0A8K2A1D8_9CYAN|nr:DUF2301 domain-containing membrane protein [Petrachloros mirabilis]NCJ07981.1 hypothetical protein [Petrachloros mirabilis ULC683]